MIRFIGFEKAVRCRGASRSGGVPGFLAIALLLWPLGCRSVEAYPTGAVGAPSSQDRPEAAGEPRTSTTALNDDATFELREEHWTLNADGSRSYREHWRVRIMNNRPIGRFGDPRITHRAQVDKVIVHAARAILPGGESLAVPEYAFNYAATDAVSGWPEYANWQDLIVSFSGIAPGVVLELDYEIQSPPGRNPWLDGAVTMRDQYPARERAVRVTVPKGQKLTGRVGWQGVQARTSDGPGDGQQTLEWTAADPVGDVDEPLSPPAGERLGQIIFSTSPGIETWVGELSRRVDFSSTPDESLAALARKIVGNERDPAEQARKITDKLRESFNFVESPLALREWTCRAASEVMRTNYGNVLEAGAALNAMLRALGHSPRLALAINANDWKPEGDVAPTAAMLDGVLVTLDGATWWHPKVGEVVPGGPWGHRWVLSAGESSFATDYLKSRGEDDLSALVVTGNLTFAADGKIAGDVRVRAEGAYLGAETFRTADAQKAWASSVIGSCVMSGVNVTGVSVTSLTPGSVQLTATVATAEAMAKRGDRYVVALGTGPHVATVAAAGWERSERWNPVRFATRYREEVNLSLDLGKSLQAAVLPPSVSERTGAWGRTRQEVTVDGATVRVRRDVEVREPELPPRRFAELRNALNELRAPGALTMVLAPAVAAPTIGK